MRSVDRAYRRFATATNPCPAKPASTQKPVIRFDELTAQAEVPSWPATGASKARNCTKLCARLSLPSNPDRTAMRVRVRVVRSAWRNTGSTDAALRLAGLASSVRNRPLKASRCRANALHRFSRNKVNTYQTIVVGDVSSPKLAKTRMAKAVLDCGWGLLRTQLQYKGEHAGRSVRVASERNTSRTCSACGARTGPAGVNGLRVRQWMCRECGCAHDRDVNAAKNILAAGGVPRPCTGTSHRHGTRRRAGHLVRARQGQRVPRRRHEHQCPEASSQVGHALRQRHHFNLGAERISNRAWVHNQQPMQIQVF